MIKSIPNDMTKNDIELFKVTKELDKLGYFISEKEFTKKYGIEL
jgi:hypothetical protein